jgi:hypothetical protein
MSGWGGEEELCNQLWSEMLRWLLAGNATLPLYYALSLPHTHFCILPPSLSPLGNKFFKYRHKYLQSLSQWLGHRHPPIQLGL